MTFGKDVRSRKSFCVTDFEAGQPPPWVSGRLHRQSRAFVGEALPAAD